MVLGLGSMQPSQKSIGIGYFYSRPLSTAGKGIDWSAGNRTKVDMMMNVRLLFAGDVLAIEVMPSIRQPPWRSKAEMPG